MTETMSQEKLEEQQVIFWDNVIFILYPNPKLMRH
jgi:hypothetical protein